MLLVGVATAAAQTSTIDPGAWIRHPSEPFSITSGETTVAQFRDCIGAGDCSADQIDGRCNIGKTDRDAHPANCVNYFGAEAYCAWVGGRLCTEPEWLAACRGTDDRKFPYGDSFDAAACNVRSNTQAVAGGSFSTAPVGSSAGCVGGLDGLYDMAGNVAEWVDACKDSYCKFRGAGYLSNDPVDLFTGCGGVCSGNQKTLQSNVLGVRCCRSETD